MIDAEGRVVWFFSILFLPRFSYFPAFFKDITFLFFFFKKNDDKYNTQIRNKSNTGNYSQQLTKQRIFYILTCRDSNAFCCSVDAAAKFNVAATQQAWLWWPPIVNSTKFRHAVPYPINVIQGFNHFIDIWIIHLKIPVERIIVKHSIVLITLGMMTTSQNSQSFRHFTK